MQNSHNYNSSATYIKDIQGNQITLFIQFNSNQVFKLAGSTGENNKDKSYKYWELVSSVMGLSGSSRSHNLMVTRV